MRLNSPITRHNKKKKEAKTFLQQYNFYFKKTKNKKNEVLHESLSLFNPEYGKHKLLHSNNLFSVAGFQKEIKVEYVAYTLLWAFQFFLVGTCLYIYPFCRPQTVDGDTPTVTASQPGREKETS